LAREKWEAGRVFADQSRLNLEMESQSYRSILKRVGLVLILVGVADIGWMIYCIIHKMSYSSSLNLFAVIAGILLMRGNLRTAVAVRWFSMFFLSACVAMLVAWPALQPMGLTLTRIRLNPGGSVGNAMFAIFVVSFLYWFAKELGREPVQVASDSSGLKRRKMRIPAVLGVALVIGLGVSLHFFLGGETAQRAILMAEKEIGPGYQCFVSSLRINGGGSRESVSGMVTAWNDKEIREIPVHWESRD
jgi:hypothetical protein